MQIIVKNPNSARNELIDMLKGAGIFLMLWGHCIQYSSYVRNVFFDNHLFKFIYSFHMPLLMLVSGFLFYFSLQKYSFCELIEHKISVLIRPIFWGSILRFYFTTGLMGILFLKTTVLMNGNWLDSLRGFWFLWSVLASSMALGFLYCIYHGRFSEILWLVGGMGIVMFFPQCQTNLYMYPYFWLGVLFNRYQKHNFFLRFGVLKLICFVGFFAMLCFYKREHYIYIGGIFGTNYSWKNYLSTDFFRWVIGFLGSVSFISLIQLLGKINCLIYIRSGLIALGKVTLQIYVLQSFLLEYYLWLFTGVCYKSNFFASIFDLFFLHECIIDIFAFLLAIGYSFGLYYLIMWAERRKISPFFFGR